MRRACAVSLAALSLLLSGCGFVHFGRLPERSTAMGDAKSAEALTNLATENKILKQELVIARRETETLRIALERTGSAPAAGNITEISTRLKEATGELAALRASYAKLQAERSARDTSAPQRELEEQLAAALRSQTEMQAENARLRLEIDRARVENATLASQLNSANAGLGEAQAALSQLNAELLAQKEARLRAERSSEALRAQLGTVISQANAGNPSSLQLARAPSADASPTAELRLNTERLRQSPTPAPAVPEPAPPPPAAAAPRKHTVRARDTLESISQSYYGTPTRWRTIYEANPSLLGGGALKVGSEIVIP
jgi:nucleoid-associated protein YgaU